MGEMISPWFDVFVPAYNCERYIGRCLASIMNMRGVGSTNFAVTMVDDASTDYTGEVMDEWAEHYRKEGIVTTVWHNETNQKMPWNLWAYERMQGDDMEDTVILIVDGDDFITSNAINVLSQHFVDPDLWLTYGSYTRDPDPSYMPNPAEDYPPDVKANRSYRAFRKPCFNHPLAFRRFLWNMITEQELQYDDGTWFRGGYDYLIMMPMLELAGTRWKYLPDILYVYNEENPLSDSRVNTEACEIPHQIVMQRPMREVAH